MKSKPFFPWGTGNPTFYLSTLAGVAGVGTTFVASREDPTTAVGTAIAAFMVGGLLGFIFGIPRYAASASEQSVQEPLGVVKYRANTNLEQISDWLTKILVGLGLTQFGTIGRVLGDLTGKIGQSLHGTVSPQGNVAAGALLLLTSIPGFLFFYLWSRVYLPKIFSDADRE